jgi:hypothetical protein
MRSRLQRHRARGRQALLWAAAVFLAVQLGAGLWLDRHGQRVRFPEAAHVLDTARTLPAAPDVMVLGTSRFMQGVNGAVAAEHATGAGAAPVTVFNSAVPAGDFLVMDYLFDRHLHHGVRPVVAVIEVAPELLAEHNRWVPEYLRRQQRWRDCLGTLPDVWRTGNLGRLVQNRLLPLHVQRYGLWCEAGRLLDEGWDAWAAAYARPVPRTPAERGVGIPACQPFENGRQECLPHTGRQEYLPHDPGPPVRNPALVSARPPVIERWLREYRIGGGAEAALERLLDRCRRHGVLTLLVAPPVASGHRGLYTPDIEAAFAGHLRRLATEYGCGFVDCRDWLGDGYFTDHHHLGAEGARCYSARLGREVLGPVWREVCAQAHP